MVLPIRSIVIAKLKELLSDVDVKHLYTFDVGPKRVFMRDIIGPNAEVPALFVVQRTERVNMRSVQRHKDRWLLVNVGFLAAVDDASNPDQTAVKFMADIQRAVPYTADVLVPTLEDPDGSPVSNQITFTEQGNAINLGPAIAGRVYGQCDFLIHYTTSHNDPRYL